MPQAPVVRSIADSVVFAGAGLLASAMLLSSLQSDGASQDQGIAILALAAGFSCSHSCARAGWVLIAVSLGFDVCRLASNGSVRVLIDPSRDEALSHPVLRETMWLGLSVCVLAAKASSCCFCCPSWYKN